MNRRLIQLFILIAIIIIVTVVIIFKINNRYINLIISDSKWNSIINNKKINNDLSIKSIKFNDYNLFIDEENNIIYYSVIESSNKYNPIVEYKLENNIKISFSNKISDNNDSKVIIYDDNSYKIYSLVVTNYPVISIDYDAEKYSNTNKIPIKLTLFDNHIDAVVRIINSDGKLIIIEDSLEYIISLIKESLGHNKRDNNVSIFGMDKHNEYILKKVEDDNNYKDKYVILFMNNKYMGIYSLEQRKERNDMRSEPR